MISEEFQERFKGFKKCLIRFQCSYGIFQGFPKEVSENFKGVLRGIRGPGGYAGDSRGILGVPGTIQESLTGLFRNISNWLRIVSGVFRGYGDIQGF